VGFSLQSEIRAQIIYPFDNRQLRQISAYNVSTVIRDNEKKFNYDEYEVDHGISNEL